MSRQHPRKSQSKTYSFRVGGRRGKMTKPWQVLTKRTIIFLKLQNRKKDHIANEKWETTQDLQRLCDQRTSIDVGPGQGQRYHARDTYRKDRGYERPAQRIQDIPGSEGVKDPLGDTRDERQKPYTADQLKIQEKTIRDRLRRILHESPPELGRLENTPWEFQIRTRIDVWQWIKSRNFLYG